MKTGRDLTLLAARLVLALIFFTHGWGKVVDPGGVMGFFAGLGLPGALGPLVGWVELICSGLLALGMWHYLAAIPLLIVILGALVLVQVPHGFGATGLERELAITALLGLLLAYGPGDWSLDAGLGDTGP